MGCVLKGFGVVFILILALVLIGIMFSGSSGRQATQTNRDFTSSSCTVADFSVTKTKANAEYDTATLTGIVTSHCATAAGVQLKWTAFNADGTVAFSSDFWPASTTNIPPNTDYAFEMMESAPRGKWTYRVEPIGVNVW